MEPCRHDEVIHEPDWTDDRDWEHNITHQHPNLYGFMTCEAWVCSDDDLDRALRMIIQVKQARGRSTT